MNLHAYVELLRSDVRSQKIAIITEMMQFTEDEDTKFWPVYREYEAELAKLNDERLALIKDYAASYATLTDDVADRLARGALDVEGRRHALKLKYYERFKSVGPAEDGGPVSSGRKPDSAAPRPPDCGVTAHRPVDQSD